MAEMVRVLRPGGALVLTVPAHRWLWSGHDEALDHQRRYEPRPLRELIEGEGLEIELFSKAVAITMPAVLLSVAARRIARAFGRMRERTPQTALFALPAPINRLLIWLLEVEAWLMPYVPLRVGASLVVVARKPDQRAAPLT